MELEREAVKLRDELSTTRTELLALWRAYQITASQVLRLEQKGKR